MKNSTGLMKWNSDDNVSNSFRTVVLWWSYFRLLLDQYPIASRARGYSIAIRLFWQSKIIVQEARSMPTTPITCQAGSRLLDRAWSSWSDRQCEPTFKDVGHFISLEGMVSIFVSCNTYKKFVFNFWLLPENNSDWPEKLCCPTQGAAASSKMSPTQ